jgi:zinc/manganese transport system ATP-binding protein
MTQASTPTGLGNTPALMRLHNLTVSYRGHPAVHHLSGAFASGRMTAVVGPNGAGKSTLLAALGGSLRSFEGRIEQPASLRRAYLPQVSTMDRSFPMRVHELVALGLWSRIGSFGGLRR